MLRRTLEKIAQEKADKEQTEATENSDDELLPEDDESTEEKTEDKNTADEAGGNN